MSLSPEILRLDQQLYDLVNDVDVLDAVAPLNYRDQRSAFFASKCSINPEFIYREKNIDSFLLKRELFSLPIEVLKDDDLTFLYTEIIDSYVDKVDQCKSIGTADFVYDSLRYYGEPSEKDIRNAHFILHLPEDIDDLEERQLNAQEVGQLLTNFGTKEGYQYELKFDENMIANALVSGTTVKINNAAQVGETDAMALAHHEMGVHLVTTLNARNQPLKILSMGCPVNTNTQEGLAILAEYSAGYMTVKRLRILALRVLAVESMLKDKNFRTTFALLKEQHGVKDDQAFTITARVYRGGGFTKDYLYLQGFREMLNAYEHEKNFLHLLAGKTEIKYLPLLSRLMAKGILNYPQLISPAFKTPIVNDKVQKFIAHAIK